MKKFATFFAAAAFVVALSACGSKPAEESTEATATEAPAEAPVEAPVEATMDTTAAVATDSAAAATPAQ